MICQNQKCKSILIGRRRKFCSQKCITRDWQINNREKLAIIVKRYTQSEKGKRTARDYFEKNKEKIRLSAAIYSSTHYYKKVKSGEKVLKNKGWGQGLVPLRKLALSRDGYTCQICFKLATEVHHIDGSGSNKTAKEQNNSIDNLISVCHRCNLKEDLKRMGKRHFGEGVDPVHDYERDEEIKVLLIDHNQTEISKILGITHQRVNQLIQRIQRSAK